MKKHKQSLLITLLLLAITGCNGKPEINGTFEMNKEPWTDSGKRETIVLGAGCFWCVEAVFERITGVLDVESGYTGGNVPNPTYKQISTGQTGHAEVTKVTFDPEHVSLAEILAVFWVSHDPTTLNRQGADVGTQYRSAIFYSTPEQMKIAQESLKKAQSEFSDKIVTEITELPTYYPAENYHQDYFNNNPNAGYCSYVIKPKLKKLGLEP